ncbi:rhomboid family intramembrane serine protease [Propionicicella superfundia]|uniref:rhomboid family intramembrane serine protease n=1 Tax=Propionicicella superfundia TaxID=348582 RepID=UPI00041AAC46|nr:rhomboid family intramembrane serine protease [Propionicicella superfundia]
MVEAPVGYQCPVCVAEGSRRSRADELPFGGRRSAGGRSTTSILIGVNIAVWVAILLTGGSGSRLVDWLAISPLGTCLGAAGNTYYPGVDAAQCAQFGSAASWAPGVADGAVWQLLTAGFAHIEVWHILSNMLVLWFIGPTVEQILGRVRFVALYLLSLFGGSVAVMWFAAPESSALGASGAIFGLLGALLILTIRGKGDLRSILLWIGVNLAVTFAGFAQISWQGHLGGLVAGAAATAIIVYAPRTGEHRTRLQWLLLGGLFVLLALLTAVRCLQLA